VIDEWLQIDERKQEAGAGRRSGTQEQEQEQEGW